MSMSKEQLIELGKKQNKSTEQCKNEKSPERPVIKVCEENYYKICGSLDWKNKRTFSFQLDEIDKVPIIEYPGNVIRKDYVEGSDIIIAVKNLGFFTDKSLFKTLSRIYDDLVITELSLNNENKTMVKFKLANYKDTSIKETYESITAFDYTNPEQVFNFLYENSIKINEDIDYEICTTHLKDRSGSKLHVSFKEAMILYSGAIQLQKANSNNRVLISKEEALDLMRQGMKEKSVLEMINDLVEEEPNSSTNKKKKISERVTNIGSSKINNILSGDVKQPRDFPKGKVEWGNKKSLVIHQDRLYPIGRLDNVNLLVNDKLVNSDRVRDMLLNYSTLSSNDKLLALSKIYMDLCDCYMRLNSNMEMEVTYELKKSKIDETKVFYETLGWFDYSNPEEVYNCLYSNFIELNNIEHADMFHEDNPVGNKLYLHMITSLKLYSCLVSDTDSKNDNDSMQTSNSFGNF